MLPDFPDLKKKCCEALTRLMRDLARGDGLLAQIPVGRDFEGNKMSSGDVQGSIRDSGYTEISSETSISADELVEKGFGAYIERVQKVAEDMQRQQTQMIFKRLEETTEEVGNVVDGKGRPLDSSIYLDAIEKVWIDFNDDGTPRMPTLVVHPTLGEKLKTLFPQWEADPAFQKRRADIVARKKKEWDDRESNRRLVD